MLAFTKQAHIFFNGLYLSLKNPESIQSTLENFFFFSKQSPRQLSTFAAADERLKPPKAGSQEKVMLIDTAHFKCVVKLDP